jgi:hypothetical protein
MVCAPTDTHKTVANIPTQVPSLVMASVAPFSRMLAPAFEAPLLD